jgi:hypothetical protein
MTEIQPLFRYKAFSRAYLARALGLLEAFDLHRDVASLFYAALELRLGIEARLTEYIEAELRSKGRSDENVKDYVATRLLKKLLTLNPDADRGVNLRITRDQGPPRPASVLRFTPVTPLLAKMHGQLGEFLHYRFFAANPNWRVPERLENGAGRTLIDCRDFLGEVAEELRKAVSGTLLSHPSFSRLVTDILDDSPT